MDERNYYMVRAQGSTDADFKEFFDHNVVAVGWSDVDFSKLSPQMVWQHFETLCTIPRPSKHEQQLRQHLKNWAEQRNLDIYIDDIGTEEVSKVYGNVRCTFSELCDAAEQKGKLFIITTNLTANELEAKYGERTIDRLKAITKFVPFTGKSLRK